ncbi:MAG TPA: hypothetical protein VLH13_04780 [Methanomassiliicoccales archaeon]|nr:hypothetical protein [Methanomassiliicoccales archaeon]
MDKNEIAPHVKEIARVLGNKVEESRIEEELDNYLNVYRVSLDTAKRSVVKNFGGDANALAKGSRRKVSEIKGGEQSIDVLVKVLTVNPKDITVEGKPRSLVYGMMADETGTIYYSCWEVQRIQLKPGDVIMITNAYAKEYNGRVDLNLGTRASVEQMPKDSVVVDQQPTFASSGTSETAKVAELRDGMNNVTITGKILSAQPKEYEKEGVKKKLLSGQLRDETGKVDFSAWSDVDLKLNDVVKISNAYVKSWRGIPNLHLGDKAIVVKLASKDAPQIMSEKIVPRTIRELESVGGALDALVIGSIVDVKDGSGRIKRCSQCKRVMQSGACRIHGKTAGEPDLRIKAILDDGYSAMSVVFNRSVTEGILGVKMDALPQAEDEVRDLIEEAVLGRKFELQGNVVSDDYGLMMIVSSIRPVQEDVKEMAIAMIADLEGFQ